MIRPHRSALDLAELVHLRLLYGVNPQCCIFCAPICTENPKESSLAEQQFLRYAPLSSAARGTFLNFSIFFRLLAVFVDTHDHCDCRQGPLFQPNSKLAA